MDKLSSKQTAILEFLQQFHDQKGYAPSMREIQAACGISSTSVVEYNLRILEGRGLLLRDREISRAIQLPGRVSASPRVFEVPLLGTIAAGEPIGVPDSGSWATTPEDTITVPDTVLAGRQPVYALRVKGTSMIEDLINDGDIVLIEQRIAVDNGATIVAWLKEQKETTLKRYYREGDVVRLQPANSALRPRYVAAKDLEVQGRVVGVLRYLA